MFKKFNVEHHNLNVNPSKLGEFSNEGKQFEANHR